uniref:Serine protease 16 n=1 Tax=Loxodonta africana TaxID=9785 RepID=G3TV79_LOXAF
QRYFINNTFYKPGGPVFLMIGGWMTIGTNWVSTDYTWITYAERLGAFCLALEHRFYGQSQPTGDLSTASLRYLRSKQVLADIAYFRTEIAKKMGLIKNKWVVFGGSYGGSLAVWSRIKYPNLFAAAVSSSAPVKVKVNFYVEYFEGVHSALATHNSECSKAVKDALGQVIKLLKFPKYYRRLKNDFMLCEHLKVNSVMDSTYFVENLLIFLASIIQRNKDNETTKGLVKSTPNIDDFCDKMTNTSLGSPYYRYARIMTIRFKNGNPSCLDANYQNFLKSMSDSDLDKENIEEDRQWFYQSCTELGFFQTTHSRNHTFSGLPLRYFLSQCLGVFGSEFNYNSLTQSVQAINMYYGGFNVNGSKIIFSNGSLDPWNALGITKDISEDLPAVFIKG